MSAPTIPGQLNERERGLLIDAIIDAPKKPETVVEVGTWLGGGSTLHILRALERNGAGHLWGIEADNSIYNEMIANIRASVPEAMERFTPLFGLSKEVIPKWLGSLSPQTCIDFVFLDGGDNPYEQIQEFSFLADRIAVGGRLFAHDAKLRKGRWLGPYIAQLDNWRVELHDISDEGLLDATKLSDQPSRKSRRAANMHLAFMRLQPIELIGAVLPKKICDLLLRLLPQKISRRLAQGRR